MSIFSKIGDWFTEYETYYKVSTTPLCDDWSASNLLNGAVYSSILSSQYTLSDTLKDAYLNSAYGKFNHIAKKVCTNPKYYNTLTKPTGTNFNTKISYSTLSHLLGISITGFKISEANPVYHAYNYLKDELAFEEKSGTIHIQERQNTVHYAYVGTVVIEDITYYLERIYAQSNSLKIDVFRVVKVNGTYERETRTIVLPIEYSDGTYIYVSYTEGNKTRIRPYSYSDNPTLTRLFEDKLDYQYPTLYVKRNNSLISDEESKLVDKLLRRTGMEWEDIYKQLSGDLSDIDNPTDSDRDYSNSVGETNDIAITFGFDITCNNQLMIEYMYKLFRQYHMENSFDTDTGGEIFYTHRRYSHKITWDTLSYTKKEGHICKWKQYACETKKETKLVNFEIPVYNGSTTTGVREETTKTFHIYYQVNKNEYYDISISGLNHASYISGKTVNTSLPDINNMKKRTKKDIELILKSREGEELPDELQEEDPSEFIIPLFPAIVKLMGACKGSSLIMISLRGVWQTYKRIKKKWYATKAFTVVRIVVAIIIIYLTWGSGTAVAWAIVGNATANIIINVLIQTLIALAIKLAIKYVCKIFKLEGAWLTVANLVSTMCEIAVASSTGMGMTLTGISSGLSDMVANQKLTLEGFADLLSTTAFMTVAPTNPVVATTYKLLQDPKYLEAINTKNWSTVLIMTASTMAQSIAIAYAAEPSDTTLQYETLKYGNTGLEKEIPVLDKIGMSLANQITSIDTIQTIASIPAIQLVAESQEEISTLQRNLEELQTKYEKRSKLYEELTEKPNAYINNIILNHLGV